MNPQYLKWIPILLLLAAGCRQNTDEKKVAATEPEPDSLDSKWNKVPETEVKKSKIAVLVLPPHDKFAGDGGSPNTRGILETLLAGEEGFVVIPFPFRELMGTNTYMVYDKKYCPPIIEKVPCDIVIMTWLRPARGQEKDRTQWLYDIKIFNTKTDKEVHSIRGGSLAPSDFEADIVAKKSELLQNVLATF